MRRRWTILGWLGLMVPGALMAQPGVITTIAGMGGFSGDGGPANQASLFIPKDVAIDADGNVYIADQGNDRIRRVDRNGIITTFAGGGSSLGDGGPAIQASLDRPSGVAVDAQGVVYIADTGHQRIRRVSLNGIITTVAGSGEPGYSGDTGLATQARLNEPSKVAVSAQGVVFVADTGNHRIRRVDANGIITTLAGTGTAGFSGDGGPARFARLDEPSDVAVDAQGFVYIADTANYRVRRVDSNGIITTFAGGGTGGYRGDGGPATQAWVSWPRGVAVDAQGIVYIVEAWIGSIRRVDRNGIITSLGLGIDGPNTLLFPSDAAVDAQGAVYIADTYHHLIRRVGPDHVGENFAGIWNFTKGGGVATQMSLSAVGVTVDARGAIYIADFSHHSIHRVIPDGTITTIAGTGSPGYSGDGGPATQASLSWPNDIAVDAQGIIYIVDRGNQRIRRVGLDGVITTFAGTGDGGFSGDGGPALLADLSDPTSVAVDGQGVVYIADQANQRIRRVGLDGTITTIAGTGSPGYSGDGGPATQAELGGPVGVAVDAQGVVYIADAFHRIRRVSPDGTITTIAGTGSPGYSGDGGPATQAQLNLRGNLAGQPSGVAVDGQGVVYIVDRLNQRIRRVGLDGIITTVAGTGDWGFSGDGGQATQARLNLPADVAVDAQGNVYIADEGNFRIRKVSATGDEAAGGQLADSPWPMWRGNVRHTGQSLYVGTQTNNLAWRFATGGDSLFSSPAIGADGTVYIGAMDGLYAIDSQGRQRWKFPANWIVESSPAIGADGTIYVGFPDEYLYAIDAEGRERWRLRIGRGGWHFSCDRYRWNDLCRIERWSVRDWSGR